MKQFAIVIQITLVVEMNYYKFACMCYFVTWGSLRNIIKSAAKTNFQTYLVFDNTG